MNVTRKADGGWTFTWPVGTPPYAIWLDGLLIDTVSVEEFSISDIRYTDVPPEIEVVNDGDVALNSLYPPFAKIQWRGNQDAIGYNIEQNLGSGWVTVASVKESGQGYYTWSSRPLVDGTSPQFRVTATDAIGNPGTSITFAMIVCRNPLAVPVSTTIVAGNLVIDGL